MKYNEITLSNKLYKPNVTEVTVDEWTITKIILHPLYNGKTLELIPEKSKLEIGLNFRSVSFLIDSEGELIEDEYLLSWHIAYEEMLIEKHNQEIKFWFDD